MTIFRETDSVSDRGDDFPGNASDDRDDFPGSASDDRDDFPGNVIEFDGSEKSTQPASVAADRKAMQTYAFETEMWLLALARTSARHWRLLWEGFDDNVERIARVCRPIARA